MVNRQIVLVTLFSWLLGACSSSEDELDRYIRSVKNRPAKKIEPIPEFKSLSKFVFPDSDKRRSPFRPIQRQQLTDMNVPNMHRAKQPLEAYPLDALKFVGTLKQGQVIWALIAQSDGMVSRVTVGNYLGKNYGQIIRIKNDIIEIKETVQVAGRWEKRKIFIKLQSMD